MPKFLQASGLKREVLARGRFKDAQVLARGRFKGIFVPEGRWFRENENRSCYALMRIRSH